MRLLVVTALVFSLLTVACGFMPTYWLFLIALVPTGMTVISLSTAANASIQLGTPAEMRGRVMGIWAIVFGGMLPVGGIESGVLSQTVGVPWTIAIGGAVCAGAGLVTWATVRRNAPAPPK